LPNLRQ